MSDDLTAQSDDALPESSAQFLHALMRFLRIVRYRKNIVIACVVIAAVLGTGYYLAVDRLYESKASLLILHSEADLLKASMSAEGQSQVLMPTYERLFVSAKVLSGAIEKLLEMPIEYREDLIPYPRTQWEEILRKNLRASNIRNTNMLEVAYRSKKPEAAVAVINAIVSSYLDFMDESHKNASVEVADILHREQREIEQSLQEKNQALVDAKRKFGDLGITENSTALHPIIQRAVHFNQAYVEAWQRRVDLEASLATVRAAIAQGGDLRHFLISIEPLLGKELILSSLGMGTKDYQLLNNLQAELIEDKAKLKALRADYGPAHTKIITVVNSIRTTEEFLNEYQASLSDRLAGVQDDQLAPMILAMIEQELAKSWQQEEKLWHQYSITEKLAVDLNGQFAQINILEHDIALARNLHDVLVERLASITINQNNTDVRVSVVTDPVRDDRPVFPRLPVVFIVCLIGSLGTGGLIVHVLDVLDDRFRSPEELREQLGIPVLAMIRQMEEIEGVGVETLQVNIDPESQQSEAFRTLRTTLTFSGQDTDRLVISSSEPGDGKTTVLSNLAASGALVGKKTLIIDADMRRPGMTRLFGLRAASGLSDLLQTEEKLSDKIATWIHATGIDGLDFLPSGPRPLDPSGLLSSSKFGQILAWAENVYDQILIDSPPILAANDAMIIGQLVDGLVLVVQPEKNHRRKVFRSVGEVASVGINLLGVIVNRVGSEGNRGYYGYDSSYTYGYGYGEGEYDVEDEGAGDVSDDSKRQILTQDDLAPSDSSRNSEIVPRRVA